MTKQDTGVCPECKQKFPVVQYGYGLTCPHCDELINVFPEADLWVDTKWGQMGVSMALLKWLLP